MNTKSLLLISCLLLLSHCALSQTKNEKEDRIELKSIPEKAIEVLKTLPEDCKRLKFYKETDGDKQSFEAKFKYKKERYSLEFDTVGIIEDIEVTIKSKNKIENVIASEIRTYFKTTYKRSKLVKIQKQYVYNPIQDPIDFLSEVLTKQSTAEVNYEIIAEVKSAAVRDIREFIFDYKGGFLHFKIINPDSYEHALYY